MKADLRPSGIVYTDQMLSVMASWADGSLLAAADRPPEVTPPTPTPKPARTELDPAPSPSPVQPPAREEARSSPQAPEVGQKRSFSERLRDARRKECA